MSPHRIWERYMQCYDYLNGADFYRQGIADLVQAIGPQSGMKILDAGAGTGNLTLAMKQKGAHVVALDFAVSALNRCLEKDPTAHIVRASLEEPLPLESETFDAVCCASVLFALEKEGCRLAVREFLRLLKPGGSLVVTVAAPEKKSATLLKAHLQVVSKTSGRLRAAFRVLRDLPAMAKVLYYNRLLQRQPDWQGYHRFEVEELRELLEESGFERVEIGRTCGNAFFLATGRKPAAAAPCEAIRSRVFAFMDDLQAMDPRRLRRWFGENSQIWIPPAGPVEGSRRILALFRAMFRKYAELKWDVTQIFPVSRSTVVFETTTRGTRRDTGPYQNRALTIMEFGEGEEIVRLSDFFKDTVVLQDMPSAIAAD